RVVLGWQPTENLPAIDELPYGATLSEFRGEAIDNVKTLYSNDPRVSIEPTRVDGAPAYWLTGPHELDVLNDDGGFTRYRVTGSVLIWQQGDLTLRLETSLDLNSALAI